MLPPRRVSERCVMDDGRERDGGSTDEEGRGEDAGCLGAGVDCKVTDCHFVDGRCNCSRRVRVVRLASEAAQFKRRLPRLPHLCVWVSQLLESP